MDISNGPRPQPVGQPASQLQPPSQQPLNTAPLHVKKPKDKKEKITSFTTLFGILLIGIAVLVVALIFFIINNTVNNEASYVNKDAYQVVNITGGSNGQAYFGHIQQINNQYIELTDVFYLQPGKTSNQFTLSNLSCALYNPSDTMIIKSDQVAYWGNLKSDSQVTADIGKWYSDKLTCSSSSDTSSSDTTSSTTPSSSTSTTGSSTTTTTPTTTTTH